MEVSQAKLDIINKKFDEAKLDDYLLKNHEYLANLFNMVDEQTEWQYYNGGYPLETHISNLKTLFLSSQFLRGYDKTYGYRLWHDFFWWRVFSDEKLNIGEGKYYRKMDGYLIRYSKCRNISDILSLVHEYIHHISSRFPKILDDTQSYDVYCEMLAILGELNCLDYLYNKGYQASEVATMKDFLRYQHQYNFNSFLFTEPLLKRFLDGKTITVSYLCDLMDINVLYNKIGIKGISQNINVLAADEIKRGLFYTHPLGLIWASALHQDHISDQEFDNLIKNINILELEDFQNLLPRKSMEELASSTVKEFDFKRKVI